MSDELERIGEKFLSPPSGNDGYYTNIATMIAMTTVSVPINITIDALRYQFMVIRRHLLNLGTGCVSQNWYLCLAASSMLLAGP